MTKLNIIEREPSDVETKEVIKHMLIHYIAKNALFDGRYTAEIRLLVDLLAST